MPAWALRPPSLLTAYGASKFHFAEPELSGLGVMTSVWHDVLERPSLRHVEVFCERLYVELVDDWLGPVR